MGWYNDVVMTDWSGHIDALVILAILKTGTIGMFLLIWRKIKNLETRFGNQRNIANYVKHTLKIKEAN